MPPWLDETESHTMGAFLLIRGNRRGVVANAVLRPAYKVAKASANAGFCFIIINGNQCPSWSGWSGSVLWFRSCGTWPGPNLLLSDPCCSPCDSSCCSAGCGLVLQVNTCYCLVLNYTQPTKACSRPIIFSHQGYSRAEH